MTLTYLDGVLFTGLDADTKPTAAQTAPGAIFFATDTGKTYINNGTAWVDTSLATRQKHSYIPADPSAETNASFVAAGIGVAPGASDTVGATVVGATTATLDSTASFYAGEAVLIDGAAATAEIAIIKSISSPVLTFASPLTQAHVDETTVKGVFGITPKTTGRLTIRAVGTMTGANGDLVSAQLIIGSAITVAAPALNAAPDASAVAVGNISVYTALTGALEVPFACEATLGANPYATDTAPSGGAPRTVGTPYYIDLQFKSSAGAAQLKAIHISVAED